MSPSVPPALRIRAYRPEDAPALLAVFRDSVRRSAHQDYSPEQLAAWAPDQMDEGAWAERRASRPTWVADVGGRPVGFSDLEADGHLDMLYVAADYQGRGVASALLDAVLSAAKEQGLTRVFTEASLTAKPFFERRGFRLLQEQTVQRLGQMLVNCRMERKLEAGDVTPPA
ncbi:putative N-acetyltransferase YafP [compost metagenome]